jgi:hypothetical protein
MRYVRIVALSLLPLAYASSSYKPSSHTTRLLHAVAMSAKNEDKNDEKVSHYTHCYLPYHHHYSASLYNPSYFF